MFATRLFDDLPTWALLLEIVLCGLLVTMIGAKLTYLADVLSDRLNLGKAWIGLILLATVTSLPEVMAGITSVALGEPDLAFGNIFGSCMFNVAIIVIINGITRSGSVLKGAHITHSLSSTLGILMITIAVASMTLVNRLFVSAGSNPPTGAIWAEWICCATIGIMYLLCMRLNYRFERSNVTADLPPATIEHNSISFLGTKLLAMAMALIVCTMWLTHTADALDDQPIGLLGGRTLGATFVGAFFLSVATSLPEIVISVTAVRMGQLDLALGNIFGSNMFNIFVIPMLKIASAIKGEALLMAGPSFSLSSHTLAGVFAILISITSVAGLVYRTQRKLLSFGFDSFLIALIYVIGLTLILLT